MLHSPSSFEVSKPSLAGISRCVQEISSTPGARSAHSNIMLLSQRTFTWHFALINPYWQGFRAVYPMDQPSQDAMTTKTLYA